MASLTVEVDTSSLEAALKKYSSNVRETLEHEWETLLALALEDILSRTPSPEEEYAYIQGYQGGTFLDADTAPSGKEPKGHGRRATLRGRSGSHGRAIGGGLRVSFVRSPGMWLKELVVSPMTYYIDAKDLVMDLGILTNLELLSHFSWINVSTLRGTNEHTSDKGVFSFFEYGYGPTFQKAKFGDRKYKLKPYPDHLGYWESSKHYPAKGMYSQFSIPKWEAAVAEIVRSVKF